MRRIPYLLLLLLAAAAPANAQVDFSARLLHSELLLCEPVPVVVTLQNVRGEVLRAGGAQGYSVVFEVTDRDGLLLPQRPETAPVVPAEVPGGGAVTFTNDLHELFALAGHSLRAVRARLAVGNRSYVTEKMFLDIRPGHELERLQARTPAGEVRTYTLRSLNRDKRDRLFLRAGNEAETLCYGVAELGRFVRLGAPSLEVDAQGNVHVLHLNGPNSFSYGVFTPDAQVISRRTFEGDTSGVRLVPDGQGGFRVTGVGAVSPPRNPMVEPLPLRRGL